MMPDNTNNTPQSFQDPYQNTQLQLIVQRLEGVQSTIDRNHRETMGRIDDHEGRLRVLENGQANLSARLAMSQILQTTFSTVAAAIAALVGRI